MEVLNMLRETIIAAAGIGVGFMLAKAVLQKQYDEQLDQEIARTREFFGLQAEENEKLVEQAAEAMVEYKAESKVTAWNPEWEKSLTPKSPSMTDSVVGNTQRDPETRPPAPIPYHRMTEPEEKVEDIMQNSRATPLDPDAREPYMITFAEYDAGPEEVGYDQISLSYFAGDGIVIDSEDEPLTAMRVEQIIGTDNLNRFGTQTNDPNMDPNVIYVRCERFQMDFEITRSAGTFAEEVGA